MLREASPLSPNALERETGGNYSRKDALRFLKIDGRQLRIWERQQLVPTLDHYRFSDLLVLKGIARLRRQNAPARLIKQAQVAVSSYLKDSPELGADVQVYKEGKRVCIQIGRHRLDPDSGQFLLDFSEEDLGNLLHLPGTEKNSAAIAEKTRRKLEADVWFERGLALEEAKAPLDDIIAAYTKAAELDPESAGAIVNLGTVLFNGHAWADAEAQYLRAIAIDPNYALAHFNLGNLYDEQDDTENALHHYKQAIRIQPAYADAHYNLALLYQGRRDMLNALHHWRAFLRLDSVSQWSQIARRELAKLEALTVVNGRRPRHTRLELVKAIQVRHQE